MSISQKNSINDPYKIPLSSYSPLTQKHMFSIKLIKTTIFKTFLTRQKSSILLVANWQMKTLHKN